MRALKNISKLGILLLLLVGCQQEPLTIENCIPKGYTKIDVDMSSLSFDRKDISTRAGETPRELAVRNGKFFVFDLPDGVDGVIGNLIEVRNINVASKSALLMERTNPVAVVAWMNLPSNWSAFNIEAGLTDAEGVPTNVLDYANFTNLINAILEYDPSNNMLKNSAAGLLPIKIDSVKLTALNSSTINASSVNLKPKFAYARIDLNLKGTLSETLENIMVVNPVSFPESPDVIDNTTHNVSGEIDTKSIQGFYTYPNHDTNKHTYLAFKVKRGFEYFYYKILLRYKMNQSDAEYQYIINNNIRYIVTIKSLDTDGYSTLEEAINLPPSNIDYDLVIDDNSSEFITNGQYYIGVDKNSYIAKILCNNQQHYEFDNRIGIEPYLEASDDRDWQLDGENLKVYITFSYNKSDEVNFDIRNLKKEIILPTNSGITILSDNSWMNNFGRHTIELLVPVYFAGGDVRIKIGELTQNINLNINRIYRKYYTTHPLKHVNSVALPTNSHLGGHPDSDGFMFNSNELQRFIDLGETININDYVVDIYYVNEDGSQRGNHIVYGGAAMNYVALTKNTSNDLITLNNKLMFFSDYNRMEWYRADEAAKESTRECTYTFTFDNDNAKPTHWELRNTAPDVGSGIYGVTSLATSNANYSNSLALPRFRDKVMDFRNKTTGQVYIRIKQARPYYYGYFNTIGDEVTADGEHKVVTGYNGYDDNIKTGGTNLSSYEPYYWPNYYTISLSGIYDSSHPMTRSKGSYFSWSNTSDGTSNAVDGLAQEYAEYWAGDGKHSKSLNSTLTGWHLPSANNQNISTDEIAKLYAHCFTGYAHGGLPNDDPNRGLVLPQYRHYNDINYNILPRINYFPRVAYGDAPTVTSSGYYWSSSVTALQSRRLRIDTYRTDMYANDRRYGYPVRAVRVVR